MLSTDIFLEAYETRNLSRFMELVFPPEWSPIAARILESGATMSETSCVWAPRWTPISPMLRLGSTELETAVKSCIYRAHDCLHQLWGLPVPGPDYSEDDFFIYKRAQMCGEVAVLTLTEFVLCKRLLDRFPEIRSTLWKRNALPLLEGPLSGKTTAQIAARLDGLLHKKIRPRWVRENAHATALVDDYVPMLEADRLLIDYNWNLLKETRWKPSTVPNARYNSNLDGLELTVWMVDDFYHLLGTDSKVDEQLACFNRERRRLEVVRLPKGWNQVQDIPPQPEKDVHTEHCCEEHKRCKYGKEDDECSVATGRKPASFPCNCYWDLDVF